MTQDQILDQKIAEKIFGWHGLLVDEEGRLMGFKTDKSEDRQMVPPYSTSVFWGGEVREWLNTRCPRWALQHDPSGYSVVEFAPLSTGKETAESALCDAALRIHSMDSAVEEYFRKHADPSMLNQKLLKEVEEGTARLREAEDQIDFLKADVANLEDIIGDASPGSHPDEWYPRAKTWHEERKNWIEEVRRCQEHTLDSVRQKIRALIDARSEE